MSVSVRDYWEPARLTPMGLLHYGPDEVALYSSSTPHVDVECGGEGVKHTFQTGHIYVTSHRIVWVQPCNHAQPAASAASSAPTSTAFALPLDAIEKAELKALPLLSFGFSTPKVVLHLYDPPTLQHRRRHRRQHRRRRSRSPRPRSRSPSPRPMSPPPARSTLPRYARLAFRQEHPTAFLQHLSSALEAEVFMQSPSNSGADADVRMGDAAAAGSSVRSVDSFTTSRAGITGIEREAKRRERAIDRTLEQAFSDLDALMANAKTIVDLSTRLASQGARAGGELSSEQSRSDFSAMMTDMGISNPVTKEMAGSQYHVQLARQMADFLPTIIQKEGGMLLLPDVYCIVNRARGTQLISPQDCVAACELFARLDGTSLRLKEFDSGVKAVVADARTEGNIAARIKEHLLEEEKAANGGAPLQAGWAAGRPYVSLSPLRLSNLWRISIVLAKQYLCVAEQLQVLCRDESTHGLCFAINHFADLT